MHLIATNVSLWIRTIVWESANEWLHYLHHQQQLHQSKITSAVSEALTSGRNIGWKSTSTSPSSIDYSYDTISDEDRILNDYFSGKPIR